MADACADSEKRKQFGNRFLTDNKNVFEHNAWDDVVWDEEQEREAQEKVALNTRTHVDDAQRDSLEVDAGLHWNNFYGVHQNRFFKDRHWLFTEFPELEVTGESGVLDATAVRSQLNCSSPDDSDVHAVCRVERGVEDFPGAASTRRMLEVGCGVGNTVLPVLRTNADPGLFMYCCDLSENAINIVKESGEYSGNRCHAFVCDVTNMEEVFPFPEESLDLVILVFVLSAISPEKMKPTAERLAKYLKPGGKIMFRDYGRYDMAQLRFKDGRCIEDNFYVRGDGTRVYFFTQEKVRTLFLEAGLVEEQNLVDRRLQVNRSKQVKMYRVWIQCKYAKPASPCS